MNKSGNKSITYPIKVNRKKWEKFKDTIPRSITPNEKINEFIDDYINKNKKIGEE